MRTFWRYHRKTIWLVALLTGIVVLSVAGRMLVAPRVPTSKPMLPPDMTAVGPVASPAATAVPNVAMISALPAVPTPGPGAMTIYSVTNANTVALDVQHVISDAAGFSHSFWSQVPAGSTVEYHLRDIPQVPSPFQGDVTLHADHPFIAEIVGYDYPAVAVPTSTPSP